MRLSLLLPRWNKADLSPPVEIVQMSTAISHTELQLLEWMVSALVWALPPL